MPVRIASHIYRNRHGTFYFRLVIPSALRCVAGRQELHASLATERRQDAIIRALPFIEALPRLLAGLQRMDEEQQSPPADYFTRWIEAVRQNVILKARIEALEDQLQDATIQANRSVPREQAERTVKVAFAQGQLKGKTALEQAMVFPWPPERTTHFLQLLASYLKSLNSRATGGIKRPPTPKTQESYEKDIGFFVTVMGNLRIGEIDREIAGEYFNILRRLPANLSRVAKYRGKSIMEVLSMGDPPQSESNASKKMERISTMFEWALQEKRKWGIDANPFAGFGQAKDSGTPRRPFTHDELRALLTHKSFQTRHFRTTYSYWLIPLALFTGAREGELCQLDVKDFVEVDGIPCIDINDIDASEVVDEGGHKKRVKNKNAKRLVPIHPELVRPGLLRYVKQLRERGQVHFFNELSRGRRDGPAHAASNWFQRFRESVGITGKQEAVFHSFRHLFITQILDSGVSPHMLAPIVGHEAQLITGQVYWNKRDATKRLPTVENFVIDKDLLSLIPPIEEVTFTPQRGGGRTKRP